jgi:hypothetical protein
VLRSFPSSGQEAARPLVFTFAALTVAVSKMTGSVSSAGSAYSQCSEAVARGPPKKGRRSRISNSYVSNDSYVSTDSAPEHVSTNIFPFPAAFHSEESYRQYLSLREENQSLALKSQEAKEEMRAELDKLGRENRELKSQILSFNGLIRVLVKQKKDLDRRLRVAEAVIREAGSNGALALATRQSVNAEAFTLRRYCWNVR